MALFEEKQWHPPSGFLSPFGKGDAAFSGGRGSSYFSAPLSPLRPCVAAPTVQRGSTHNGQGQGHAETMRHQAAPDPLSTAGIVLARIFRSSDRDHSSMYFMSSSIH